MRANLAQRLKRLEDRVKPAEGRQANIDRLMMGHFQTAGVTNPVTRQSHEKTGAVN